ncbi:MAG: response regulator transcription factor [Verrucomicrobiota bacterium]|jgi:DNA-binding NarL/FixJ family response regulator
MKRQSKANVKKVFLVEDHPVYAEGLVEILKSEPGLAVCGQAGSAEQALRDIPGLKPDLVLVDITLPGMSGLDLIKRLRPKYPGIKLLVISMREEQLYAARVLRAGGDGYVMKQQDPKEIMDAIRDVLAGRIYVSDEVMDGQSKVSREGRPKPRNRPIDRLSDLELEILGLLGAGKSNPDIASRLDLKARSLTGQYTKMRKKLRLSNTNALIRFAVCWTGSGES